MKSTTDCINDALDILQDTQPTHLLNSIAAVELCDAAMGERRPAEKTELFLTFLRVVTSPVPMARCSADFCGEWFPTADLERVDFAFDLCPSCARDYRRNQSADDYDRRFPVSTAQFFPGLSSYFRRA